MTKKDLKIKIVKFQPKYAEGVSKVITQTFKKFNFNAATEEAAKEYLANYSYIKNKNKFLKTLKERRDLILIAIYKDKPVGVLAARKNFLANLFVLEKYQKLSIGKNLIKRFETNLLRSDYTEIKVRASLFAISFYMKMGFKKTTGVRNFYGHKIQPMKKVLTKS